MEKPSSSFSKKLLAWYSQHKRDLPWRRNRDPYRIWVSEIMLQQTTVETVIPYYERFLARFPNVAALARADEEDVLKLWSGLGYYSRARNLLKASQDIMKKWGGRLPSSAQDLKSLPGIGRYTAGAVSSIAFDLREPLVDGNVARVLSRVFCIAKDPRSQEGQKEFWSQAASVLPPKDCGDFNQALMELGATVCLPTSPQCKTCPVFSLCRAAQENKTAEFPKSPPKTFYQDVRMAAAVIRRQDGKFLMVQRPDRGLLKKMWEVPMVEGTSKELTCLWCVEIQTELPVVKHSVLNRRLKIQPFLCRLAGDFPKQIQTRWIGLEEIDTIPMSSMNKKILTKKNLDLEESIQ